MHWHEIIRPQADNPKAFRAKLEARLGGRAFLAGSGRAALALTLMAARELSPDRDEVILPDYTCWTVPAAIARAGLLFRPVDIQLSTLGLSADSVARAINSKTLAIVAAHLFGLPSDVEAIENLCGERGILLIDDAAQALGAKIAGRPLGGFGDIGLLSFGRGKNMTTLSGGAALVRHGQLAGAIEPLAAKVIDAPESSGASDRVKLSLYKLLFPRLTYGAVQALPFLNIGRTEFDPQFPMDGLADYRCRLGVDMLERLDRITRERHQKAKAYLERIKDVPGVDIPTGQAGGEACYLRFPILTQDEGAAKRLRTQGHRWGLSGMYPAPVSEVAAAAPYRCDGVEDNRNSRRVARCLVTLPTHHGIGEADIERIAKLIRTQT